MKGRKPKPTNLKILGGTRPERINADEVKPPPGHPDPPACLDDVALAEWGRMIPILDGMGLLSQAEGPALALYCQAFSRWSAAEASVKQFGLLVRSGDEGVKPNPAVAISRDASAAMARMLAEFGLTPSSRSRVKAVDSSASKDALEDFLKRG